MTQGRARTHKGHLRQIATRRRKLSQMSLVQEYVKWISLFPLFWKDFCVSRPQGTFATDWNNDG